MGANDDENQQNTEGRSVQGTDLKFLKETYITVATQIDKCHEPLQEMAMLAHAMQVAF
jgi:hypothetical protein